MSMKFAKYHKIWYNRSEVKNCIKGGEGMSKESFKQRIQVKEQDCLNNMIDQKGKHYAISDIHGMYDAYAEAIQRLSNKDHLYIIGDVIDRGEDGIKILLDIIERQKNPGDGPKITFLMGNHEVMFLATIEIMLYYEWGGAELRDAIKCNNFDEFFETIKSSGITQQEAYFINNWIKENHGHKTLFSYLGDIEPRKMKDIYTFLLESNVILPKKIGEQDFLFVHSMPINDKAKLDEMKKTGQGYNIMELTKKEYSFMLTERNKQTYQLARDVGFTTICGHTPRYGEITNSKENGFVRIDAGCGHKKKASKLALYCIEDDKVEYIEPKREVDLGEPR